MAIHRHRRHYAEPEPAFHPWDALRYREIQKKIGEELRERFELPKELPRQLLTVLMQLSDQSGDE
jgi:hypothetical protein